MSITTEIRTYADKTVATAQAQINDVTGQANELVGKLTAPVKTNVSELRGKATDLRVSAEKAVNLDALKSAVEPYLAQVKGVQSRVHEQFEALLEKGKSDPRFGKYVELWETRVYQPVLELANRTAKQVETSAPPVTAAAKKAPARAAAKTSAAKTSATRTAKATATKATATAKSTAKAPAKKAPAKKA